MRKLPKRTPAAQPAAQPAAPSQSNTSIADPRGREPRRPSPGPGYVRGSKSPSPYRHDPQDLVPLRRAEPNFVTLGAEDRSSSESRDQSHEDETRRYRSPRGPVEPARERSQSPRLDIGELQRGRRRRESPTPDPRSRPLPSGPVQSKNLPASEIAAMASGRSTAPTTAQPSSQNYSVQIWPAGSPQDQLARQYGLQRLPYILTIPIAQRPVKATGSRWDEHEEELLIIFSNKGITCAEIASHLPGRTGRACYDRLANIRNNGPGYRQNRRQNNKESKVDEPPSQPPSYFDRDNGNRRDREGRGGDGGHGSAATGLEVAK